MRYKGIQGYNSLAKESLHVCSVRTDDALCSQIRHPLPVQPSQNSHRTTSYELRVDSVPVEVLITPVPQPCHAWRRVQLASCSNRQQITAPHQRRHFPSPLRCFCRSEAWRRGNGT